jgi:putative membrane protein
MWGCDGFCFGFSWCWVIPIAILIMMVLCCFMMKRRTGMMMCGPYARTGNRSWGSSSESAREILDKRYARGEIGKEEYEEKKKDLE